MPDLKKLIADLESNTSLCAPHHLRTRIEALEQFEFLNVAIPSIQAKLEAANDEAYESMRRDIRLGADALSKWARLPDMPKGEGYDYLDEIVAGIFRFEEPATQIAEPNPEMVAYQPTPARLIFDLFRRTALTEQDILVDFGSGLGHVALLTNICTSARAIGIELEPAYVHIARQTAEALNLKRVTFVQQDARTANLAAGTVFYLYTPFKGSILRTVLERLRCEASRREIRVCTYGPCTTTIAAEEWLQCVGTPQPDQISVFRPA